MSWAGNYLVALFASGRGTVAGGNVCVSVFRSRRAARRHLHVHRGVLPVDGRNDAGVGATCRPKESSPFWRCTALAANLVRSTVKDTNEKLNRAIPPLALGLSALPVLLGLAIHVRATSELARTYGSPTIPTWIFVVVMVLVAVSNRISAYLVRRDEPTTSAVYFFFSAGALIVAAAGLLRQFGRYLRDWTRRPLLMLIPLAYLIAARLWMGHSPERPLVWVAHAGTAVILFHVLFASLHTLGDVLQPDAGAPRQSASGTGLQRSRPVLRSGGYLPQTKRQRVPGLGSRLRSAVAVHGILGKYRPALFHDALRRAGDRTHWRPDAPSASNR